eukprot:4794162-Pyramimonas_sp.AAC.1
MRGHPRVLASAAHRAPAIAQQAPRRGSRGLHHCRAYDTIATDFHRFLAAERRRPNTRWRSQGIILSGIHATVGGIQT